jgi:hypothetical protein
LFDMRQFCLHIIHFVCNLFVVFYIGLYITLL